MTNPDAKLDLGLKIARLREDRKCCHRSTAAWKEMTRQIRKLEMQLAAM